MKKCNVCSSEINDDYTCPYCGYDNAILTVDSDYSREYTSKIIGRIKDFSIDVHKFKYSSDKNDFVKLDSTKEVIADAKDCYRKTVWSKKGFAQDQDVGMNKDISIYYTIDGQQKSVKARIKTVRTVDWWRIGIRLDEDLRLSVFLGTSEEKSGVARKIPLKLL